MKVKSMVLTNRNFGVKVWMRPIRISAKTISASDVNIMFVATIFFGLPKIGDALKFGNFALNKVAIKLRFGLSATSAAVSVVEPTLKQKPVVGAIHEELTCSFSIVDRFGIIRIGSSEHDKSNVVAGIARAPTVVIAIHDVEGITRNHS